MEKKHKLVIGITITAIVIVAATLLIVLLLYKPYKVKYVDYNNELLIEKKFRKLNYDTFTTKSEKPTRVGYTFSEWVYDYNKPLKVVTAKAKYERNIYKVSFETNDKNIDDPDAINVKFEERYKSLPTITKDNYVLVGWHDGEKIVDDRTIFRHPKDIVLTAVWKLQYYYFGRYPQSVVEDEELIDILKTLTITNDNGYYEYDGNEYAKLTSKLGIYDVVRFNNGELIEVDKEYYFLVETIKWYVLEDDDGSLIMTSYFTLDYLLFHHTYEPVIIDGETIYGNNYELSDIRQWLNNEFYNKAFTDLEKEQIQISFVDNSKNSNEHKMESEYYSNNTYDKVYLLGGVDQRKYYTNEQFYEEPWYASDYTKAQTIHMLERDEIGFWLRTPRASEDSSVYVGFFSASYVSTSLGVRPVIKINI